MSDLFASSADSPCIVTIGVMDGVHLGHRALVRHARAMASRLGVRRVAALCFDPHPLAAIKPDAAPARLSTFEQRARWLRQAGADEVIRLAPEPGLLNLDPAEFIDALRTRLHAVGIVEGSDFRFGRRRAGDAALLGFLCEKMGLSLHIADPVEATLNDHAIVRVSSTMIRWLLKHGRVADAANLLGRPHEIAGIVKPGDRRGRTIGFPTANIITDQLLPADAVYACEAVLPSGERFAAAVNVGARPTIAGAGRTLEAHLLLPNAVEGAAWSTLPGVAEYDWPITLRFISWVRDQARFTGLDALKAQIGADCRRVRAMVLQAPDAVAV